MDEQRIRRIVQDEIRKNSGKSRFGLQTIPYHVHDGVDSQQIQQNNILPSSSITGSITFARETTYTIRLNASFTPRNILAYGVVTGTYDPGTGALQTRILSVGSAQLTPTFYLIDPTPDGTADNYVVTSNKQYPFNGKPAQSSSYINVTRGSTANNTFAGVSEDHLLSVVFPDPTSEDDIRARVTVTDFSKTAITLEVPYLDDGWEITLNYVIT